MKGAASERGITQEEAEQDFLMTMRPTTLINRFTTTEEVANMVVYVCSVQASGTTGPALRVDGGATKAVVLGLILDGNPGQASYRTTMSHLT